MDWRVSQPAAFIAFIARRLPSTFVPTAGHLTACVPALGNLPSIRKKEANSRGSARGGGAGRSWNWLMHNSTVFLSQVEDCLSIINKLWVFSVGKPGHNDLYSYWVYGHKLRLLQQETRRIIGELQLQTFDWTLQICVGWLGITETYPDWSLLESFQWNTLLLLT